MSAHHINLEAFGCRHPQAAALKVDMTEIANLSVALERLDLWQASHAAHAAHAVHAVNAAQCYMARGCELCRRPLSLATSSLSP